MDVTTIESQAQDQGPKKGIVIIVIIILLGTNGLLLWQFFDKKSGFEEVSKSLITATHEKDELQTELNSVKAEREKLVTDNSQYKDQLSHQDSILKIKEAQIQHLISIGGPAQLAKAKAEISKLKEMNQLYALQMDSLSKANAKLATDVQNLNTNLTQTQNKNTDLNKQVTKLSDKIAAGSILTTSNIVSEALKVKSNGKEVETNKAKQVGKIHTKFTIGKNRVIDAGQIDIYIRVLGPDGNLMSSGDQSFTSQGTTISYTMKKTVDYRNEDAQVDAVWAQGTQFTKGKYSVEIYHGGEIIGRSMIELK